MKLSIYRILKFYYIFLAILYKFDEEDTKNISIFYIEE